MQPSEEHSYNNLLNVHSSNTISYSHHHHRRQDQETPLSSRDQLLSDSRSAHQGFDADIENRVEITGTHSRNTTTSSSSEMAWFTIRSDNWTGFTPRQPTRTKMSKQRRMALLRSYLPDWIICIVLAALFFSLDSVTGFRREFSIDDASLRFPYAVHERVPVLALYMIAFVAPFVLQIVTNLLTIRSLWDFHNGSLGLLLSVSITGVITQFTKITVGRPRPDVISRCAPPSGVTNPEYGLVTWYICTQTDEAILKDGFRSFPSGHSSLSFAGLGFLSFYLAGKMHLFDEKGHTTKAWLALAPLSGAALVAISRTMDYRHHWHDVLVGSLLGLVMAFFAYRQYYPPLSSPLSHKPFSPRIRRGEGADGVDPEAFSEESQDPILPTTRPGVGRGRGRGDASTDLGTGGGGIGRGGSRSGHEYEVVTHPAVPHMHPLHSGHPSRDLDQSTAYKPYGSYRDSDYYDANVEDLQMQANGGTKGVGSGEVQMQRERGSE